MLGWDPEREHRPFILWPGDINLSSSILSISAVICCDFPRLCELQSADSVAAFDIWNFQDREEGALGL